MEQQRTSKDHEQWERIFSATELYRVEILKALLEEADIPAIIMNKQDSAYVTIGFIELYVLREDIIDSKRIIDKFLADE